MFQETCEADKEVKLFKDTYEVVQQDLAPGPDKEVCLRSPRVTHSPEYFTDDKSRRYHERCGAIIEAAGAETGDRIMDALRRAKEE